MIEFERNRRVRVHPEILQTKYQTRDTIQVTAIELLEGPDGYSAGRRLIAFNLQKRSP